MDERRKTLFPKQSKYTDGARGLKEALQGLSPHALRKMVMQKDGQITTLSTQVVDLKAEVRRLEDIRVEAEKGEREADELYECVSKIILALEGNKGVWVLGPEKASHPHQEHAELIERIERIVADKDRLDAAARGLAELWATVDAPYKRRAIMRCEDAGRHTVIGAGIQFAAQVSTEQSGGEVPKISKAKAEGRTLPIVTVSNSEKF